MPVPVIIIGNLTIDDVIQADGSSQMGTLGGNSVYAAAAALTWVREVGVVARCGADFPAAALSRLREAGADTGGIRPVDGPTVRNWVIYEADGSRHWVYRTPRGRSAEVAPRPGDIPDGWLDRIPATPVVHVAAMPLAAAAAIVRSVRARAAGAVITLDTHVEEWAHEEYFITRPNDPVVVVAPAGAARDRAWEILSELEFIRADAVVVSDMEPPGRAGFLRLAAGAPEELSPVLAALPLAQLGFQLARLAGKRSYNFPSEQARDEHYATIHRATLADPA